MSNEGTAYKDSVEELLAIHPTPTQAQSVAFAENNFISGHSRVCFLNKLQFELYGDSPTEVAHIRKSLRCGSLSGLSKVNLTKYIATVQSSLRRRGVDKV